jgi:polyhydroxyalkanoate synthesis regulator phasin
MIMAGIGMAGVLRNEAASFTNRVIEQGQTTNLPNIRPGRVRRGFRKPVSKLFNRLNIPTKSDIDNLNNQITNLLEKVEALEETQTPLATQTASETPENQLPDNDAESDS